MIGRRGFIGALSGLPLAAVVQPKTVEPDARPMTVAIPAPQVTITINGRLLARDRDTLARQIGDSLTGRLQQGTPGRRT